MSESPSAPPANVSDTDPLPPAPATSRHVEVDGLQLHYLDYGAVSGAGADNGAPGAETRPVLLCVHGSAANAHWFDWVANGLRDEFRVLSLDQRGHGDSEWAADGDYSYERYALDLGQLVERIGFRNIVLVGHSMGGMVSLACAATRPAAVSKLVIVDTTMKLSPERVSLLRGIGERPGRSYASREDYVRNYRLRPAGARPMPQVTQHLAQTGCRQFDDGQWRNKFDRKVYASRVGIEGLPFWDSIDIPALYISGALSDRMNPQVAAMIHQRCPQCELREVADANHHVTLDNPHGFNRAVMPFLRAPL